jgi:hypothetical protein
MNVPLFNQQGWNVGKVYNVAGNLILTETSSREDFLRALGGLKQELAALDQIDATERAELEAEVDGALADAGAPEPSKERVVSRLQRLAERLSAFGGVVAGALEVAHAVTAVAAWAGTFL